MDADDIRPASPSTLHAIERLDLNPDSPHLRIHRAVIKQDIRKLSPFEDETEVCEDKEDDGTSAHGAGSRTWCHFSCQNRTSCH